MGQLRAVFSKQDIESGLLEMVVGREYVLNTTVCHERHAYTVCHAPVFVLARPKKLPAKSLKTFIH